jgi:3,4-dihydroxy 2-butanone 4-phosphate synthase
MTPTLQAALQALRRGETVLVYDADGREEETDLVVASEHITAQQVRTLRQDGGGLLCTTLGPDAHRRLGLPWLSDLIQDAADAHPVLRGLLPDDIRYDASKPAFGLTLNHRSTYTGITDGDRATTIRRLAELTVETEGLPPEKAQTLLGAEFRAPGHVMLLNGADAGLAARQGHTELGLELMRMAGLAPSCTLCEMMDGTTGKALSKKDAQAYAEAHGLVFLTGQDILDAWRQQTQGETKQVTAPTSA